VTEWRFQLWISDLGLRIGRAHASAFRGTFMRVLRVFGMLLANAGMIQ
jgi:hypothetical protein